MFVDEGDLMSAESIRPEPTVARIMMPRETASARHQVSSHLDSWLSFTVGIFKNSALPFQCVQIRSRDESVFFPLTYLYHYISSECIDTNNNKIQHIAFLIYLAV